MRNLFEFFKKKAEKNDGIEVGEIVREEDLPQPVEEEINKLKSKYNSASNEGLLRISGFERANLGDGKTRYFVNGIIDRHVPTSISGENYTGNESVRFRIDISGDGEIGRASCRERV